MKFLNCQTETSMKFNLTVNSAWIRDCFAIWITHEPKLSRAISPQPIFTSLIYVNCYIVVPLQHIGIWKRNIKHLYLFHKILTFQFTACVLPCNIFKEYPHYSNMTMLHHFPLCFMESFRPTTSFCPNKQGKRIVPFPLRSPQASTNLIKFSKFTKNRGRKIKYAFTFHSSSCIILFCLSLLILYLTLCLGQGTVQCVGEKKWLPGSLWHKCDRMSPLDIQ